MVRYFIIILLLLFSCSESSELVNKKGGDAIFLGNAFINCSNCLDEGKKLDFKVSESSKQPNVPFEMLCIDKHNDTILMYRDLDGVQEVELFDFTFYPGLLIGDSLVSIVSNSNIYELHSDVYLLETAIAGCAGKACNSIYFLVSINVSVSE